MPCSQCFPLSEQEHVPCSSWWVGFQTCGWWLGLDSGLWGPHFHWIYLQHAQSPLRFIQRYPGGVRNQLQWNSIDSLNHASCHVWRRWVHAVFVASVCLSGKITTCTFSSMPVKKIALLDRSHISCFILPEKGRLTFKLPLCSWVSCLVILLSRNMCLSVACLLDLLWKGDGPGLFQYTYFFVRLIVTQVFL